MCCLIPGLEYCFVYSFPVSGICRYFAVKLEHLSQVSYFDVYNGFAAIGGIALMIYVVAATVMLQCDHHHR